MDKVQLEMETTEQKGKVGSQMRMNAPKLGAPSRSMRLSGQKRNVCDLDGLSF